MIELMISLVLFSVLIAGVLSVAVSMVQGYREQRQAVSMESSARGAIDYLTDVLRQASPGVSDPTQIQDAGTCTTGAITVTNNNAGPDTLDVIYAAGSVYTSTRAVYGAGTTSLAVTDASQLTAGDYVVITNFTQGHLVRISNVSSNTLTLDAQCGGIALPAGGYASGSLVIRAQHARFTVSNDTDGTPTLWMDPDSTGTTFTAPGEPLAEGIEDFQVAVGTDTDGLNGISEDGTTSDEWHYNNASDTAPSGPIRAIRVTLVARAQQALVGNATPFYRPAAEDHPGSLSADAYRRRVLHAIVELRNIGGSP
jgi:type II secretory pathway pseudopilin PulG